MAAALFGLCCCCGGGRGLGRGGGGRCGGGRGFERLGEAAAACFLMMFFFFGGREKGRAFPSACRGQRRRCAASSSSRVSVSSPSSMLGFFQTWGATQVVFPSYLPLAPEPGPSTASATGAMRSGVPEGCWGRWGAGAEARTMTRLGRRASARCISWVSPVGGSSRLLSRSEACRGGLKRSRGAFLGGETRKRDACWRGGRKEAKKKMKKKEGKVNVSRRCAFRNSKSVKNPTSNAQLALSLHSSFFRLFTLSSPARGYNRLFLIPPPIPPRKSRQQR